MSASARTDDDREPFVVRWTPESGGPRRLRFEPRQPGGWNRVTQRLEGGEWVTTGQEIVAGVQFERAAVRASAGPRRHR